MEDYKISQITEKERPELVRLLNEANLPVTDLPATLDQFYLAKKDEKVIGSIGLELLTPYGLLRSMVVTKGMQGEGIGKALLQHLLLKVSEGNPGVAEIFLITENAETFFKILGFKTVSRESVPDLIKNLPQFKGLCPASAAVMNLKLNQPGKSW